jgi:hypothetical protein
VANDSDAEIRIAINTIQHEEKTPSFLDLPAFQPAYR